MTIGIPRAFLYYRYRHLWETFFGELGVGVIVSPETNKAILDSGEALSIDESCLPSKIYMGHVAWLEGRCDHVLVPRVASYAPDQLVCSKLWAAYDVVRNTFRAGGMGVLDYNIDYAKRRTELAAFMRLGRRLGKRRLATLRAYLAAKRAQREMRGRQAARQKELLARADMPKILVVAHSYNVHDRHVGAPVLALIEKQGCLPVVAEAAERPQALRAGREASPTLKWSHNQELLGAVSLYKGCVDGIALLTAFPCGPDSLVNEIIVRRTKDKPIISLVVDGLAGHAGLETRIESFADIIRFGAGKP